MDYTLDVLDFSQSEATLLPRTLRELIATKSGTYGYLIGQITDTGIEVLADAHIDRIFPSASMIKVAIMETFFEEARQGRLNVQENTLLRDEPRVEGGGALQELSNHHRFTLLELCRLMMVLSDNWATNGLISKLTMERINQRMEALHLPSTRLRRKMMDWDSQSKGLENTTSVRDLANLFFHIFQKRDEPLYGTEMWRILGRQQWRDKIPFTWDEDIPFYHKTGTLKNVEHDGGIYMSLWGNFVIIGVSEYLSSNREGVTTLSEIGKIFFDYLG